HARDPRTGKPTPDPDTFMQFLPEIKERTNAVVNITTGGGQGMSLEQRLAAAMRAKPEMCSLNMGSMNFGRFGIAKRIKDFKFDWEAADLESSRDYIFRNTYADIEYILRELGETHGVKFEHECYDVGHLYNLAYFVDEGLVKPPFFVQTIFGILGGIGTDPEDLLHMKRTADRLFGDDYHWSILGAGRHQLNLVTMGAIMGGNVRVGLEDNIYLGKGELAKNNGELVAKTVRILKELSLDIATPDEARETLGLKGVHNVGF
ncbi:MAG: 3-keto-5-aminohexanoate cleavage protein, partial [Chloroflexota bacterium]|nr:3-keto-5-aminohexanoate cleavage protein [Chloroflexota bacterium]